MAEVPETPLHFAKERLYIAAVVNKHRVRYFETFFEISTHTHGHVRKILSSLLIGPFKCIVVVAGMDTSGGYNEEENKKNREKK